jgi:hypothetical protein
LAADVYVSANERQHRFAARGSVMVAEIVSLEQNFANPGRGDLRYVPVHQQAPQGPAHAPNVAALYG